MVHGSSKSEENPKSIFKLPEILSGNIDKEGPLPLYYQIKQILIRYIAMCKEGDVFPTETQLCDVFSVSRPTVRQAIAEIVQEGLVERTAGRGTFITASKVRRDFRLTFKPFDDEMKSSGHASETRIIGIRKRAADEMTAAQLGISEGDEIYRLERLRLTDKTPLVYMFNYLPADLLPDLEKQISSLIALRKTLENVYGLNMIRATRRLEAVSADMLQAEPLEIPAGSPVQFLETHVYLDDNRCIEYSTSWYRGDRSSFFLEIDRAKL